MAPHPSQNRLLSTLPSHAWQRLEPDLEWTALRQGNLLYEAGDALTHVYFPVTAVVSLTSSMADGASAELAVVGKEGFAGVCAILGGGLSLSAAVVQVDGYALRMRAAALTAAAQACDALRAPLLRYTQALFIHMAQSAACNRHHVLDEQLCRWLLLNLDRSGGSELRVTQERIARALGVRREGITIAALRLQQAGVIRYGRGRIEALDRDALAARSCECYRVVCRAYERVDAAPALAIPAALAPTAAPHFGARPRQGRALETTC
jgi:CRP-like cAMP-binding protein